MSKQNKTQDITEYVQQLQRECCFDFKVQQK